MSSTPSSTCLQPTRPTGPRYTRLANLIGAAVSLAALSGCLALGPPDDWECTPSTDERPCPAGKVCELGPDGPVCRLVCQKSSDCPGADGCVSQTCKQYGASCSDHPDCIEGFYCSIPSGQCVKNPPGFSDCTVDTDNDTILDCLDTCVDVDDDGFGNGTNGNSGCGDSADDCDETSRLCTTACDDLDADNVWDCRDTCVDADGDGYGVDGGAGTCAGADCDDTFASCINDCTDLDDDAIPDCGDSCLDSDGDGAGLAGGAGNSCTGPDCKDNDDRCSADCTECPPASLSVSVPVESVPTCDDAAISIDLDAYTGAAAQLVCEAPDQSIVGPVNVRTDAFGAWSDRSTGVSIQTPDSWCEQDKDAIEIQATASARYVEIANPLDMTGWENVHLRFAVGYTHSPPAGHDLAVLHCCGVACTMNQDDAITINNAEDGGQDACRFETVRLPLAADCAVLEIRLEWEGNTAEVLVSDMEVLADLTVPSFTEVSAGMYETTATSCQAVSVPVACYWPNATNPGRTDIKTIEWE